MGTTTHRIPITSTAWTNVSNGNMNCSVLLKAGQRVLITIGPSTAPPAIDAPDFIAIEGPSMMPQTPSGRTISVNNLAGDDDIFIRAESNDDVVMVVRGDAYITGIG